jgi:hypothetical protein
VVDHCSMALIKALTRILLITDNSIVVEADSISPLRGSGVLV